MKKFGISFIVMLVVMLVASMAFACGNGNKHGKKFKIENEATQFNGGAIVGGDAIINNSALTIGGNDKNGAFVGAMNESTASYKIKSRVPVCGAAATVGGTYGYLDPKFRSRPYPFEEVGTVLNYIGTEIDLDLSGLFNGNWSGSYAYGITGNLSTAYATNPGWLKVNGSGIISHMTYATNGQGSHAYTSGSATFGYDAKVHGKSIVGGGVAGTAGYSGISVVGDHTSMFSVSASGAASGAGTFNSVVPHY